MVVLQFEYKFQIPPPVAREFIPQLSAHQATLPSQPPSAHTISPALKQQLQRIASILPKDIKLVGEFSPFAVQLQIANNPISTTPITPTQPAASDLVLLNAIRVDSGNRASVLYTCSLKASPGRYRYYYFVDNRPELAPDQPVEFERNVITVSPNNSTSSDGIIIVGNSGNSSSTTSSAPIPLALESKSQSLSSASPATNIPTASNISPSSAATAIPNSVGISKRGGPSAIISSPMGWGHEPYSSSLPASAPLDGRRTTATGTSATGSGSLFPEMSASLQRGPPPASAFGRKDPFDDDEGWGQEIPQALLTSSSTDSLPNPAALPASPPKAKTTFTPVQQRPGPAKNAQIAPMELPAHLERALLNAAPIAGDPGMLPLPHHVMLNHLYERPPSSSSWDGDVRADHIILGLTVRYKDDKFVTLVLYKPVPPLDDEDIYG